MPKYLPERDGDINDCEYNFLCNETIKRFWEEKFFTDRLFTKKLYPLFL